MLTIYRRHRKSCKQRAKGRKYRTASALSGLMEVSVERSCVNHSRSGIGSAPKN